MQNSNQPNQQTDKNKGDQSAVEQQKKETMKNTSPENAGGAQNAQQMGQGQTGQSGQAGKGQTGQADQTSRTSQTGQSGQSGQSGQTGQAGQGQTGQADRQVTGKNQQTNNNDGAAMNPTGGTEGDSMTAQDHDRMEEKSKGMTGQGAGNQSTQGLHERGKGQDQGQSKNQGK